MRLFPWLCLLAMAACQPLPHPLAEDRPPVTAPIMSPPDAAGIVVDPVAGAPAVTAVALAEAMADALRKEDVPANTTIGNRRSYRLSGTAKLEGQGDSARVTLDWRLAGPDGHAVAENTVAQDMPRSAWQSGDKQMAQALAQPAAPSFARKVEADLPAPKAVTAALVAIAPVAGAPGDGPHSLSLAIADALHRAGIDIKDNPSEKETYRLAGKVEMGLAQGGKQKVKITWSLARADGSQIGVVTQENAVPAGSLDGPWGDTAYDVALAASDGVVALIKRAQEAAAGT